MLVRDTLSISIAIEHPIDIKLIALNVSAFTREYITFLNYLHKTNLNYGKTRSKR